MSERWTSEELATLDRVYKIATWEGIRNALPMRPKHGIRKKANELGILRRGRHILWKTTELAELRRIYAKARWSELIDRFPSHSRGAIKKKAVELGLRRDVPHKPSRYLLIRQLRQLRVQAGLAQNELADKLKIGRKRMSDWECGRCDVSVSRLMRWADALDVRFSLVLKTNKGNP